MLIYLPSFPRQKILKWLFCDGATRPRLRAGGPGGTPLRPNSQATPQSLDQRSKMKDVVPKMARRRGSEAGQSKRRQVRSCSWWFQALQSYTSVSPPQCDGMGPGHSGTSYNKTAEHSCQRNQLKSTSQRQQQMLPDADGGNDERTFWGARRLEVTFCVCVCSTWLLPKNGSFYFEIEETSLTQHCDQNNRT